MKRLGILSLIFVLSIVNLPVQKAEASGNTSIKTMKTLEKGDEYQYDIDGDGEKDTIYWTSKKGRDSVYVLSVYVNEDKIYSKKSVDYLGVERVALCNINQKDDYVEILVESESSSLQKNCVFLRYDDGDVTTLFNYAKNHGKKRYEVGDIRGTWKIKGNGTVIFENSIGLYSNTTGSLQIQVPLKLKNGKLVYTGKNDYKLSHPQAYNLEYYNYKAGNRIKVYKKASKNAKTAFTMKKGERFCGLKIHVVKWGKADKNSYTAKRFFLQVTTNEGRTGWVYIPSLTNTSQDFTGGGSVSLPAWS